jgi:hypothetical protein
MDDHRMNFVPVNELHAATALPAATGHQQHPHVWEQHQGLCGAGQRIASSGQAAVVTASSAAYAKRNWLMGK